MGYLSLVIFALVVGVIAIFIDRRLEARSKDNIKEGNAPKKGFFERLRGNKVDLVKVFDEWAPKNLDVASNNWLATLPEKEKGAFVKELNTFCNKLSLELAWLDEKNLAKEPKLKSTLENTIKSFCNIVVDASQVQTDVKLFNVLLEFDKNPTSRKYRTLRKKLFTNIVENDLSDLTLSEYVNTPDREKEQRVTLTIQEVAQKDRQAFNRALRDALELNGVNGASAQAASKVPVNGNKEAK